MRLGIIVVYAAGSVLAVIRLSSFGLQKALPCYGPESQTPCSWLGPWWVSREEGSREQADLGTWKHVFATQTCFPLH